MKPRLFTPGPTPVPEETLLELARPVTYHRAAEAKAILAEVTEDLKYVFQTCQPGVHAHLFRHRRDGSGGGQHAWRAGEKAILCTAGRWGERWRGILKAFAANIVAVEVPYGKAVTPEMLAAALAANPDAKAVFATLSETSTGVGHDLEAFGKIVAKTDALLVVDGISGLGAMECRMDAWNIDVCVTGSQKALMLPPGLAFVSRQREGVEEDRRDAGAELLPRPAPLPEVAGRERHAVHPGEHADPGAAGEPEAHPGGGHREPVGAARPHRRRVPGRA